MCTQEAGGLSLPRWIAATLVVVAPWFHGAFRAPVRVWLFAGTLTAVGLLAYSQIRRDKREPRSDAFRLPWATLPLILALSLGLLQLVPLPRVVHTFVSPGSVSIRSQMLPGATAPESELCRTVGIESNTHGIPMSMYPASTRQNLTRLTLATSFFLFGVVLVARPRVQVGLYALMALNGAALALFGVLHRLSPIAWLPEGPGVAPFASFINRNNAAGYLNLCLAGAIGLSLWATRAAAGSDRQRFAPRAMPPSSALARAPANRRLGARAPITPFSLAAWCLVAGNAAGVFCSLSRGGFVSIMGAGLVTILCLSLVRSRGAPAMGIAAAVLAGLCLVGWIGQSDAVWARLETLSDVQANTETGRVPHWLDALQSVPRFWLFGSGLGTCRFVYRPFQTRPIEGWFFHAENQYVEALVDAGVAGLLLLLLMIALVGRSSVRLLQAQGNDEAYALGAVGLFALVSQAIHGAFDFGLYIPANITLFALVCGTVVGADATRSRRASEGSAEPRPSPGRTDRRRVTVVVMLLWLLAASWAWWETRRVAALIVAQERMDFPLDSGDTPPEHVRRIIHELETAVADRPDDAESHRHLADLHVYLFRLLAMKQLQSELRQLLVDESVPIDPRRLWAYTSSVQIHGRAHQLVRENLWGKVMTLRRHPLVRDHLLRALRHAMLARRACCMLPQPHLLLGQLCVLVVNPNQDQIHLQRVRRLGPGDAAGFYVCGLLDWNAGRVDQACADWRQSLGLSKQYEPAIVPAANEKMAFVDVLNRILPQSAPRLVQIARRYYADDDTVSQRNLLLHRALNLLEESGIPDGEAHSLRGSIYAWQGDTAKAAEAYAAAVRLRPDQIGWRFELSRLLLEMGEPDEALAHARWCARMDPQSPRYRKLLAQIHRARLRR